MPHSWRWGFCFLAFLALGSCGYSTKSLLPGHLRTIYIAPFTNEIDLTQENTYTRRFRSYRPRLEGDITSAITEKFVFDGYLQVSDEEGADMVLQGRLIDFRRDPLRYSTGRETVEEYRLSLVVDMQMEDRVKGRLMWRESSFVGDATFFTSGARATSEETALTETIDDLAERVVARTVEGW
ncbi:MAG: hypothetical protein JW937_06890 [Candidatus Omnitrophica bacterium]|nr:hypothetical protein [Candidatus Omnitrophota bacterium]